MNEHQVGILRLKPADGGEPSMRRAVVDDPENSSSLAVGPLFHDLIHETVKGRDSGFALAATEEFRAVDVQAGEVGVGSQPPILVPDLHRPAGMTGVSAGVA